MVSRGVAAFGRKPPSEILPFVLRRSAEPPLRPAQSRRQSARGLAQSKTLRAVFGVIVNRASVLECGSPLPLWKSRIVSGLSKAPEGWRSPKPGGFSRRSLRISSRSISFCAFH